MPTRNKPALVIFICFAAQSIVFAEPKFENYPISSQGACRNVTVNLKSDPEARLFRTQLRGAAKRRCPEFAGHYIVATWGCGSPCQEGALIDVRNGQVYKLPFLMRTGADYHPDSALMVVNPNPGTLYETEWWVWDGRRFKNAK